MYLLINPGIYSQISNIAWFLEGIAVVLALVEQSMVGLRAWVCFHRRVFRKRKREPKSELASKRRTVFRIRP